MTGIPAFLTRAQKSALRARGLTDEEMFNITPEEAHKLLNGGGTPLEPNRAEAERFLAALDPSPDARWCFQTFTDDKKLRKERAEENKLRKKQGKPPLKDPLAAWRYGTLADHYEWLVKQNARGAGIFVTVNETDGKGRETTNVIRIRAGFGDLDGAPLEPVMGGPLLPHIAVESSPGRFHTYWNVTDMPLDQFEPLQKAIASRFSGDPSIHDLPRVMRLPSFIHRKAEPFVSRVLQINEIGPYKWKALREAFPPVLEEPKPQPAAQATAAATSSTVAADDELSEKWKKLNSEAIRRYSDWVPDIFPSATPTSGGGYRVSSADLGRDLEEDLSFHSGGIKDFGVHDMGDPRHGSRTPIDIVEQYLHKDFNEAVRWLARKLGLDPNNYLPKPGTGDPATDAEIACLAKLSDVQYDRERKPAAKKLGIRVRMLDHLVAQKQNQKQKPTVPGDGGLEDKVALEFSAKYANHARYVHPWGKWFVWNGIRWVAEETLQAFDRARELCRAAKDADHKTVAAVIALARTDRRQAATTSQWDIDPWLLGTPKGTVNLRTGKLSAPKSADYITKIVSVIPSDEPPRDSCPMFLTFLNRVTNGDEKLQDYLQRVCGYCLTGDTTEDALFFHYGKGGNGKSVFLNTICGILGDYHEAADMELFVVTHGEKHPTDLASLRGARLVTAVETDEGKRWAEAKLCQMTGGDPIKARFMRQDFFTYNPQFKLMFAGNHKPAIRNVTKAMARRFHLIPWLVTIPESEVIKSLSDDLKAEWPGILRWMIDGCLAWQKQGLKPPEIVCAATKDYLESEDTMQNFFKDCCVIGKNQYDSFEHLWDGYVDWCESCREFIGTKKAFGQKLKDKGYESRSHGPSRAVHYFGIRCIRENRNKTIEELKQKMEEERLRRAATGNGGTVPQATAKSKAPSFMPGRARELHAWSLNWIADQEAANRTFGTTDLEAELRIMLREELPSNEVETAIKQIMDLVFAV
jgi:putative DNA primase/helicase